MPAGARIPNTAGTIQVDNVYRNLSLRSVATVTTTQAYIGATYSIASFSITGDTPIVAIRSSVAAGIQFVDRSGSTWTYYLRANSSSPVVVTYYVFDVVASNPSGVGMRVWDTSGRLTFHSMLQYMRVVDFIAGKSTTAYGTRTYQAGRQYAWVTGSEAMYSKVNGSNLETCQTGAASVTNGITVGKIVLSSFPGGGGSEPYSFSGLVVDVTNY